MYSAVSVMFCGPHDEGECTPTRRIDQAIKVALRYELPLFVAGDAFGGKEVTWFQARALKAGVPVVECAYDVRCCTLADAQAVAQRLNASAKYHHVTELYLCTDWWHMERARTMLEKELITVTGVARRVIQVKVMSGPIPTETTLRNERQGIEDYLNGVYGERQVYDPLPHCPCI
jgi:hypothetical protein